MPSSENEEELTAHRSLFKEKDDQHSARKIVVTKQKSSEVQNE